MVEKANDMLVSKRQKHNGMSWSLDGSIALAIITAFIRNGDLRTWVCDHKFSLQAKPLLDCSNDQTEIDVVA